MAYCVEWRLLGRSGRLLDQGQIGGVYDSYGHAAAAVSDVLRAYPEAARGQDGTHWYDRRSADADIELRVWIGNIARAEVVAACEI